MSYVSRNSRMALGGRFSSSDYACCDVYTRLSPGLRTLRAETVDYLCYIFQLPFDIAEGHACFKNYLEDQTMLFAEARA